MTAVVLDEAGLSWLARRLLEASRRAAPRRYIAGIAGIPGAGKSTLARRLLDALNAAEPGAAALVPMDGFHLPNRELDARGLRDRKGSPPTFDAEAYATLLARAREPGSVLAFPVYDRTMHEPVWRDDARQRIGPSVRIVLTEGNYLLLPSPPWSRLKDVLDECWLLETPMEVARASIIERHRRGGRSADDARAHYERNDLPNTTLILNEMREPDLRLCWPEAG